jgi:hypothetical protein
MGPLRNEIKESIKAYEDHDCLYFESKLADDEKWRVYKEYRNDCTYFDIETTGLDFSKDSITTIVAFDGKEIKSFVNGINLNDFEQYILNYSMCVTFSGKRFDIPFVTNYLGIFFPLIHMDLYYELKDLGFHGGLKKIEKALNISRESLTDIDGSDAITLWNIYKNENKQSALETLLAYNCADAVNLRTLADFVYNTKCDKLGHPEEKIYLENNKINEIFTVDKGIIENIIASKSRSSDPPD